MDNRMNGILVLSMEGAGMV